jgi:hypothetical protein
MTVEAFEAASPATIVIGATYDIPWPYMEGGVIAVVVNDGERIVLDPADYAVDPTSSGTDGSLTLTAGTAALYEGGSLIITRETPVEQGWQGLLGYRERGLEQQLDATVMRVQELGAQLQTTFRADVPIAPVAQAPGRVIAWDEDGTGLVAGPTIDEVSGAQAAAETALLAAAAAAQYAPYFFETLPDLLGSPTVFPDGQVLNTRIENLVFQVATSEHYDPAHVTSGGVNLFECGPNFSSRAQLAAALERGILQDGQSVTVAGYDFVIDSTATGMLSALYSLGVDGVRGNSLLNFYVFPGFKTQDNTFQHIHISPDGRRFKRLNRLEMLRGGGDAAVGARDAKMFWVEELKEWWLAVTAGDAQSYDFGVFRSPDAVTWRFQECRLGAGVRGTMLPGAVTAAPQLWGPKLFRGEDGQIHVVISIRTGPDYTNHLGDTTSPCFRPWRAVCTDLDALAFSDPVHVEIGTLSTPKLAPDFIYHDSLWHVCIKDSAARNIEIWSSPLLTGPWTEGVTLDLDAAGEYNSLEGPTWAPHRYYEAGTGILKLKWRVHVANNRDAADDLKGIQWYFESLTGPQGPYDPAEKLDFGHATRNGSITNVALDPDPRALETLRTAVAAWGGQDRDAYDEIVLLESGAQDLYPQQDFLYYVEGTGNVATLTFREKTADRFWLASLSVYDTTGIEVVGAQLARAQFIGFASPVFHVVEMRWCEASQLYLPVGNDTKKRFKAEKNATQAVNGTATVTFQVEDWDIGAAFAAHGWTPGRGLVELRTQVTFSNAVAGEIYRIAIQKNGTDIATARAHGAASGALSILLTATDQPASSDVYTVAAITTASRTISDTATSTWFEGRQL